MTVHIPLWVPPTAVAKISPPLHISGPIPRTGLLERLAALRDDVPLSSCSRRGIRQDDRVEPVGCGHARPVVRLGDAQRGGQ